MRSNGGQHMFNGWLILNGQFTGQRVRQHVLAERSHELPRLGALAPDLPDLADVEGREHHRLGAPPGQPEVLSTILQELEDLPPLRRTELGHGFFPFRSRWNAPVVSPVATGAKPWVSPSVHA